MSSQNPNDPNDTDDTGPPDDQTGLSYLKAQVKLLPMKPGVYRMYNAAGEALYVGKAHQLAKRVASYTRPTRLSDRLMRMVADTVRLEITITPTEVDALLLESNLIKKLRPRYNILLKDDKSYAHILLPSDHPFPQLIKHRGKRRRKGDYFGPFASTSAVNRTVTTLARAFLLRTCADSIFSVRTRPCLQYQIKRCTAPCVGYVSADDYAHQVAAAKRFLSGQSDAVQRDYATNMQASADELDFETAALWRNRIRALTMIQANQDIHLDGVQEADILAIASVGRQHCVQVFFVRGGANFGNTAFFPHAEADNSPQDILSAFIGQFYENKTPPKLILTSHLPSEHSLLAEALSLQAGRRINISRPVRGTRRQMLDLAQKNADEALARRMSESASQRRLLEMLVPALRLEHVPERIEIYDNSHIQGAHPVGAMVVAGPDGFIKAAYRKFNMRKDGPHAVQSGDDFAMMRQMIFRRFERALKEDPDRQIDNWPDLLLIDGGRGQLNAVLDVLAELGLDDIAVVGVSKGPDRNAGRERFHKRGSEAFTLPTADPAMHFLQRLRDESHRFAIGTHRTKRTRDQLSSPLDGISGIGAKRKKALLAHFGSARSVSRAGIRDLQAVDGISATVAQTIYDWFHNNP